MTSKSLFLITTGFWLTTVAVADCPSTDEQWFARRLAIFQEAQSSREIVDQFKELRNSCQQATGPESPTFAARMQDPIFSECFPFNTALPPLPPRTGIAPFTPSLPPPTPATDALTALPDFITSDSPRTRRLFDALYNWKPTPGPERERLANVVNSIVRDLPRGTRVLQFESFAPSPLDRTAGELPSRLMFYVPTDFGWQYINIALPLTRTDPSTPRDPRSLRDIANISVVAVQTRTSRGPLNPPETRLRDHQTRFTGRTHGPFVVNPDNFKCNNCHQTGPIGIHAPASSLVSFTPGQSAEQVRNTLNQQIVALGTTALPGQLPFTPHQITTQNFGEANVANRRQSLERCSPMRPDETQSAVEYKTHRHRTPHELCVLPQWDATSSAQ